MVYLRPEQFSLAYDEIKRNALHGHYTVAVFVAPDADALCACRILVVSRKENLVLIRFILH
jgi:hypothetical protein